MELARSPLYVTYSQIHRTLHGHLVAVAGIGGALTMPMPAIAYAAADAQDAGQERSDAPAGPEVQPDIVVRGERYGAAAMQPERELGEDDIEAFALNSIKELLGELGPQIDGSTDKPILLVNGQRIANPREITSYPTAALQRVEILPPDAALRYGYPPGQRVLNLVLKREFSAMGASTGLVVPTAGGRDGETLVLKRFFVRGDKRANLNVEMKRDAPLYRSSRKLPPTSDLFAAQGNVLGATGGEIDPALSALAGTPVSIAGVPASAATTPPDLVDFLAGAGTPNQARDDRDRTLLAGSSSLSLDASATMPVGRFNATLSLNVDLASSRQLTGLAPVTLFLPAGSNWSPFSSSVSLLRTIDDGRPLATRQRSQAAVLSLALNGQLSGWNLSLSASAQFSGSLTRADQFADIAALQARIDANDAAFNPFGSLPDVPVTGTHSYTDNSALSLRMAADRHLFDLPAGVARLNASAGFDRTVSTTVVEGSGKPVTGTFKTSQVDNILSLSVPLTGSPDALPFLGKSVATLGVGRYWSTGQSARSRWNASLFWAPASWLQLTGNIGREDASPTAEQLNAPIVRTANVRIYDLALGEVADITQITGGNPALSRGSRRTFQLNGSLRPIARRNVDLRIAYARTDAVNGIGTLPSLTPVVESAFPDRVVRDAAGHLLAVDMRPINIARDQSARLSAGFTVALPFGPERAVRVPSPSGSAGAPGKAATPRREGMVQISATQTWTLANRTVIRDGLPLLDRLAGDGGGVPRRNLDLNMTLSYKRLTLGLVGHRRSQSTTRLSSGMVSPGDLIFLPMSSVDLRVAWSGRRPQARASSSRRRDVRMTLAVSNVFDARQRVRLASGEPAPGYSRDESDPLGRVIRLSLDRQF